MPKELFSLVDRIKTLRESAGLTQAEVARQLGMSRSGVNAWEMGLYVPSTQYIVELAKYFNVSTDYLLGKSTVRNLSNLNSDNQLFDISGLDEENIKEVQNYIKYIKWRMREVQ